jgi:hypothetical protein
MAANAIIRAMLRVVFREIVILLLSLAAFPGILILVLAYSDSLQPGILFISRELGSGAGGLAASSLSLWFKFFVPYLVVQAVRAYRWSQRSSRGKKWANLYFSSLLALIGARSLYVAWDLFYFMYALGDMPEELLQFIELEGVNLGLACVSSVLAVRCFLVFLESKPNRAGDENARVQSGSSVVE